MQSQGQRRPTPLWLPVSFPSLCLPHLPFSLRTYSSQSSGPLVTKSASSSLELFCLWLVCFFVLDVVLFNNLNECILFVQSRGFHFHTSTMYLDSTHSVSLSGSCFPFLFLTSIFLVVYLQFSKLYSFPRFYTWDKTPIAFSWDCCQMFLSSQVLLPFSQKETHRGLH